MNTDEDIEVYKNEAAVQQRLASMFAANRDEISIPKIYVDMTGDIKAAAVLDELMFWTLPKKGSGRTSLRVFRNGGLWLAVRRSDWWERKRLTERQSDTAIAKLAEIGLIEKDVFLFDGKPTVHIRLKMSEFVRLYGEKLQEAADSDGDEYLSRDISDLYEMMGFPNENVNSNLQNGEMLNLQNGEIINSLQQPPTTTRISSNSAESETPEREPLTPEEIAEANRKVDVILQLNSKRGDAWDGRDQFRDNHLHYADWWHKLTNLKCGKRAAKSWKKAFSEWQSEGLEIRHLQESYNTDLPWKKIIADPNEITKKAIAIKAMSEKGNDGKGPDVDASGAPITY